MLPLFVVNDHMSLVHGPKAIIVNNCCMHVTHPTQFDILQFYAPLSKYPNLQYLKKHGCKYFIKTVSLTSHEFAQIKLLINNNEIS